MDICKPQNLIWKLHFIKKEIMFFTIDLLLAEFLQGVQFQISFFERTPVTKLWDILTKHNLRFCSHNFVLGALKNHLRWKTLYSKWVRKIENIYYTLFCKILLILAVYSRNNIFLQKYNNLQLLLFYNFMFISENAFNGFKTFAQLNLQLQLQLKWCSFSVVSPLRTVKP